jgi:2-hydroxymuconate-semialdehyde hydrolase
MPVGDSLAPTQPPTPPEIGLTVQAGGVCTNYLESGTGFPLLLLHGSGPGVTAYANWRGVIPAFSERYRVLAPDLRGFGYTTTSEPATSHTISDWLDHLTALLDTLEVSRAHVIGNSFGGALALALAARHPSRVSRLVVMGAVGVPFELTPGLDAVWGYQPSLDNMRNLLQLFVHDHSILTPDLVASRYQASARPGVQRSYTALFPPPRQRHIHALCPSIAHLRAIDCPTLIIHGREDQVIPPEVSVRLHQILDRSELHLFGQCGHWTQIEKRDRFIRLVDEFLDQAR